MQYFSKNSGLLLLTLCLLAACGGKEEPKQKVLRPVVYQVVSKQGAANQRTFNGTAQTDKVINLSFRNNGIITAFNMDLGQRVRKGQLLARLDNVQARLAYEQAVAQLNSSESQMKTAKLSYDRTRSLYEKGSASLSDFENAKNAYQNAVSGFESTQRSVAIQKEQISYGFIYAPENGVIAAVNAEIDENVSPGQMVAVLNAGDQMTISLGIPESVINNVKPSSKVQVTFPALRGKAFEGEVTEISPAVNAQTATYPVKVALLNATEEVRAGMAANVSFDFSEGDAQTLMIPAKSVGEDSNGRFVFLVNEGGSATTVKKHRITIGQLTTQGFEVLSGLTEGQKIATAGLQTLLDGQEVTLAQ